MAPNTNSRNQPPRQQLEHSELAPDVRHPASAARFQDLPVEILQHIYRDLSTVSSIRSLSLACRRFYHAYASSQRLNIVQEVVERQFGPLDDVIQLVTLNSSQPAYVSRNPAFSMALAMQIVEKGLVVNRWVELYPLLRWRTSSHNRRFLNEAEAFRLKRALYRFWIYAEASAMDFDLPQYSFGSRKDVRFRWLRLFSTHELRELEEVQDVLEDMLRYDCCPSDSTIQRHYTQVTPTRDLLDFGKHNKAAANGRKRPMREVLVNESWGDNARVTYDIAHLIRMTPAHLLHFRENCNGRLEREHYIDTVVREWTPGKWGLYEWPSALRWDLGKVLGERTDGERRGAGARWITWDPEGEDEDVDESNVAAEKIVVSVRVATASYC